MGFSFPLNTYFFVIDSCYSQFKAHFLKIRFKITSNHCEDYFLGNIVFLTHNIKVKEFKLQLHLSWSTPPFYLFTVFYYFSRENNVNFGWICHIVPSHHLLASHHIFQCKLKSIEGSIGSIHGGREDRGRFSHHNGSKCFESFVWIRFVYKIDSLHKVRDPTQFLLTTSKKPPACLKQGV